MQEPVRVPRIGELSRIPSAHPPRQIDGIAANRKDGEDAPSGRHGRAELICRNGEQMRAEGRRSFLVRGVLYVLAVMLAIYSLAGPASAQPSAKEWTFLVYLDGDNNLEGAAIDDLNEMEAAGSNT